MSDQAFVAGYKIGAFISSYFLIWLVVTYLYRRGRRNAMLSATKLLKKNNRDVILYLRAFLDDSKIKMWARANNGRIFLERLIKISFEELVTDHLWRYGNVVGFADPNTKGKLTPLGAARDFMPNETWQEDITDLMQKASIIVAVVHKTEGFVWEINKIVELGFQSKLILLMPPVKTQELNARWDTLVHELKGVNLPQSIDFKRTRAVIFPDNQVVAITADERNDWAYETALDNAERILVSKLSGSI
jgi:hypothetical protein